MLETDAAQFLPTDESALLRAVLDAVPSLLFVVDHDVRILECNAAAARLLDAEKEDVLQLRSGDVLHCVHSTDAPGGCGRGVCCRTCVIRACVRRAFRGEETIRRRLKMELTADGGVREIFGLITARGFVHDGQKLALLVIEDISQLVELQRIVPICACCKKVRDDDRYWMGVDAYFKKEWDVEFSHGYCPACAEEELARLRAPSSD